MRLVHRLGQTGAITATVMVALGACAIAASVMTPADGLAAWALAAGGSLSFAAGMAYLAAFYGHRDRSLR